MTDFAGVAETAGRYAIAFHAGAVEQLNTLFLPGCTLRSARDGTIAEYALTDWLSHVGGRPSPEALGHALDYKVRGIDFAGSQCASVIIEMSVPGTLFVDCLHLVRAAGEWRIVAKTFHAEPNDVQPAS